MASAADIPVAHTPPGGYGTDMPPPILEGCTDPLTEGAPDLRGTWRIAAIEVGGQWTTDHPLVGATQRIEQCGDRLVVTASGVIHDMRCDGTTEHGVHDVMQVDFSTPIVVRASYEDGVHVLRPEGMQGVVVTRRREGPQMVWEYGGLFTARLDPVG